MKNKMKKVLSMLIVMAMLFSVGMTAFAADDYDITIKDANAGHTYGAYQLFSGNISGTEESGDSYLLVDIKWGASVVYDDTDLSKELLAALVKNTMIGGNFNANMSAEDVADVLRTDDFSSNSTALNEFAEIVGRFFLDKEVTVYKSTSIYTDGTYTIEDVAAGYYLIMDMEDVKTDASTLYILDVAKDIAVTPKTGVPTVEKKVMEDSTLGVGDTLPLDGSNYNDVADWDIGQTESFTLYANLPTEMWGYDEYSITFTDSYDYGFTITDASGTALEDGKIDADNYKVYFYPTSNVRQDLDSSTFTATLTTPTVEGGDGTIVFECSDIKGALVDAGVSSGTVTVVIEYYAELNENAVLGLGGNFNDVYLKYTNDPYDLTSKGETEIDEVVVFTFEFEGTKVDADYPDTTLTGAEFILGRSTIVSGEGANVPDEWAVIDEDTGYFKNWTTNEEDATTVKTDVNGIFVVYGLDSGTYFLRETVAPVGYNKLGYDVKIQVVSIYGALDETASDIYTQNWTTGNASDAITGYRILVDNTPTYQTKTPITIKVENESGSKLPETGDTGRAIFYALGAMGFSAAAIVLITRKRMSKYDK